MKLMASSTQHLEDSIEPVVITEQAKAQFMSIRANLKTSLKNMFENVPHKDSTLEFPIFVAFGSQTEVGEISFYALSHYCGESYKFFFDIIHSLLPEKRMNVVYLRAVDFRFNGYSEEVFTLYEIMVQPNSVEDVAIIWQQWPRVQNKLRLGLESEFYARRILEIRGMSTNEKTGMIFRDMARLIKKSPHIFDFNLLSDMQYFLVVSSDEFKKIRNCRHLSRLIGTQFYFHYRLKMMAKENPNHRHFSVKIFKAKLVGSEKPVLCLIVGANLKKGKEKFEKRHLLKAIQAYIPSAKILDGSFQFLRQETDQVCAIYCEIEKENNVDFTSQEIRMLRKDLPNALERRVEHLMLPVFMPRNEEEVYRNILMLGSQIKYVRDIPQVNISFDEQNYKNLIFTVILVRVLKTNDIPIQKIFLSQFTQIEYIHDRTQFIGNLRRKHKKEATVFRVKINKEDFLRNDFTIDLNKARQWVFNELSKILGELRDFNGGMIAKQNEVLRALQVALEDKKGYNELLLENFFYSLTPVILRNVFDISILTHLYNKLVEAVEDVADFDRSYSLKISTSEDTTFVMIKTQDRFLKDKIHFSLEKLHIESTALASMYLSDYDVVYIGYIYRHHSLDEQRIFCQTIERTLSCNS